METHNKELKMGLGLDLYLYKLDNSSQEKSILDSYSPYFAEISSKVKPEFIQKGSIGLLNMDKAFKELHDKDGCNYGWCRDSYGGEDGVFTEYNSIDEDGKLDFSDKGDRIRFYAEDLKPFELEEPVDFISGYEIYYLRKPMSAKYFKEYKPFMLFTSKKEIEDLLNNGFVKEYDKDRWGKLLNTWEEDSLLWIDY